MRTTLTLDPDVYRLVEEAMHHRRVGMKTVINEALRAALTPTAACRPYRVEVHHSELAAGIDPGRLNQLADELSDEETVGGLVGQRTP